MQYFFDRAVPSNISYDGSSDTGFGPLNLNSLNVKRRFVTDDLLGLFPTGTTTKDITVSFSSLTRIRGFLLSDIPEPFSGISGLTINGTAYTDFTVDVGTTGSNHRNLFVRFGEPRFSNEITFKVVAPTLSPGDATFSAGHLFLAKWSSIEIVNPDYGLSVETQVPSVGGSLPNGQSWNSITGEDFDVVTGSWSTILTSAQARDFRQAIRKPTIVQIDTLAPMLTQDYNLVYNTRIQSFGQRSYSFTIKEIV